MNDDFSLAKRRPGDAGFTLIELMVTVAVVAVLASITYPSFAGFVVRSKVPSGLVALTVLSMRMEQVYQDTGRYGAGGCGATPGPVKDFEISCTLTSDGQGFTATATGQGMLRGYRYAIDNDSRKTTLAHPNGVPATACWTIKGGASCDM